MRNHITPLATTSAASGRDRQTDARRDLFRHSQQLAGPGCRAGRCRAIWWFVGDAIGLGYDPVGTVECLSALPGLVAVRGNGDRRLATNSAVVREIAERFIETASADNAAIWRSVLAETEWTRDLLQAAGLYEWVAALPLEAQVVLPDGTRGLLVHAAPGTDEGSGVHVDLTDSDLRNLLSGTEADLVIVGHTHRPLDRTVDGVRVHNLGSVSNPPRTDKRAMWSLLEVDERGYRIERQFAGYDPGEVLARMEVAGTPALSYVGRYFRDAD